MDLATQSAEAMQSMERHPARARGRVAEIRSDADEPSKALRTQSVAHFHLGSARDCALVNRFQVTPPECKSRGRVDLGAVHVERLPLTNSLASSIGSRGFRLVALYVCLVLPACASVPVEWVDVPLADNVYFEANAVYQTDQVEIPVPANSALEYMLDMKQGHSVSYLWRSTDISNPELLLAEFHGHTVRDSEAPGDVMIFKESRGDTSDGYLVAPFDGVHGWYFSNETDSDINIALSLSGFYTIADMN
jgi:hypothetical protein